MTRRVAGILGGMWAEATIPFLKIVTLSIKKAIQTLPDVGRVGILGSSALRLAGVFDAPLDAAGLRPVWPKMVPTFLCLPVPSSLF